MVEEIVEICTHTHLFRIGLSNPRGCSDNYWKIDCRGSGLSVSIGVCGRSTTQQFCGVVQFQSLPLLTCPLSKALLQVGASAPPDGQAVHAKASPAAPAEPREMADSACNPRGEDEIPNSTHRAEKLLHETRHALSVHLFLRSPLRF